MLGGKYILSLTRSPAAATCPHEGWRCDGGILLHLPSVSQGGCHNTAILGLSLFAIFSQVRRFTVLTARTLRARR